MAKQTFEKALKQLEEIVRELEVGDLPLEKAIAKFEEGIRLSKFCAETLDETEKRIQMVIRDPQGNVVGEPFPKSGGGDDTEDRT